VTVLGLGRHGGGVGAARYLARAGAIVTVSDAANATALAESLAQLQGVPVARWSLAGHLHRDVDESDLVIVNPAIPPGHPLLERAAERGVSLGSEIELFLRACPATVIGVTGSAGKSTTAAMTAALCTAAGRRTWLGGNFGGSLLDELPRIGQHDTVVLELSSFQLARLADDAPWPERAVVTSYAPNHLDWHGSESHYRSSKQRLLRRLPAAGAAVLNPHDAEVRGWAPLVAGRMLPTVDLAALPMLAVPGEHNRHNALCAWAAAQVEPELAARTLAQFSGLAHRMERVGQVQGRVFYNDSKATTPQATLAALASLEGPLWLLAGGSDKGCSWEPLGRAIAARCRGAALYGATRHQLRAAIRQHDTGFAAQEFARLDEALAWTWRCSGPGDAILLSPACASFDQYRDYAERGASFAALVRALR
jgi:UDP-N-acetylmuramoylalanine--D-glutamate ligase